MAQVEVSVIIPNYNHAPFLKQRIDSVLNQTFQNFELIILDDCSTDDSKYVIEVYRGNSKIRHIVYNEINSGSTFKQWQKGIALSKGEYIWIAESDDYCLPAFLKFALENLKGGSCSLAFCQSERVDENNTLTGDYFHWTEDIQNVDWHKPFCMDGKSFISSALKYKNAIPNASAVVFRKKVFDFSKIENYKMKGDWLFWINYLMYENIIYSPVKFNYYRNHQNTTRNQWSNLRAVRSNMEELGVKYFLYVLGFIKRRQLKTDLYRSIDISLPYFKEFKKMCLSLNLPFAYLLYFFTRKFWLKYRRSLGYKS